MNDDQPLLPRRALLLERAPHHPEGPDAQHWQLEIEPDDGGRVDTIVMRDGALKWSVTLLERKSS